VDKNFKESSMGMYTELLLKALIKEDTPDEIHEVLGSPKHVVLLSGYR
jgi:hypothetical protein